jgi:3'(2'), 5'-bisphosphate nucleotidase
MRLTTAQIESLVQLARTAGKGIMEVYNRPVADQGIEAKEDRSPLTEADKIAHHIIAKGLESLFPGMPLISEEGKETPYERRATWDTYWLVDPLDGTKEFIKRNGQFTVNIALIEGKYPVFGVIYVPATGVCYVGALKSGATKITAEGKPYALSGTNGQRNFTAVGSSSHADPKEAEVFSAYGIQTTKSMGSSLKFCLLAEGEADIYYRHGPTMEWDTAAGQAIVEAAGGQVLDLHGHRFAYNKKSLLNTSFLCLQKGISFIG